ncbi:uncharacterized protein [Tursiops truncatus]|uniref:Uncharacterized protein LOC109552475 n=1 Tax=Tursiops truncatus TaxID=9739 RepID=A0A2U4CI66_TURTR|nr:uncharacterized protein LOC109552475 [Tursiops truncatus]XP_033706068.1 uncharacterized protein LOC109552475 [Tursiops truncatus]
MLPSPPAPSALPPEEPREVPGGRCPDHALEAAEPKELRREQTGGSGSEERRTERAYAEDLLFFYDHLRKVIGVIGMELLYCYHWYMATHFVLQATI